MRFESFFFRLLVLSNPLGCYWVRLAVSPMPGVVAHVAMCKRRDGHGLFAFFCSCDLLS